MSVSKGGILVLTDPQYASYLHQKCEAQRLNHSAEDTVRSPKALSDTGEQADDLIEREATNQVGSILKQLQLEEVPTGEKTKYEPTGRPRQKFSSHQELQASISRLTEKKRQISLLPVTTPKPKIHRRVFTTRDQFRPRPLTTDTDIQQVSVLIKETDLQRELLASSTTSDSDLSITHADFNPTSTRESHKLDRLLHSPKVLPSKRTLSKYLLEVQTVEGALKSTASTDDVASSVQQPRTPKVMHRSNPKTRKSLQKKRKSESSKPEEIRQSTSHKKEPMKMMTEEQKKEKIVEEIKGIAGKNNAETGSGLGDLMRIGFKFEPERAFERFKSTELGSMKHLNARVYSMLSHDPSELYRVITTPHYSDEILKKKFVLRTEEWSQEHEAAFKSMMRKSHSVNSMAKTRRFRELEKKMPETRTKVDREWRYDVHSPWVNDLDFHGEDYYTFDWEAKTPRKHKHISNIRVSGGLDEIEEVDPEEVIENEQRAITGLTRPISTHTLRTSASQVQQLRRFEDAKKGYELIYKWQKSKPALDRDSASLASHIIKDLYGDMKQMTKARYSYLSAKIARQRAKAELSKKVLLEAEEKRVELRKKQVEFQREVSKTRSILRKIYGNEYLKPHHRVLENTSHSISSPLFYESMVKLGFLPSFWEPHPTRLTPNSINIHKPDNLTIPDVSKQYVSNRNYEDIERITGKNKGNEKEKRRHKAAVLVQSWYRGVRVRRFAGDYRKALKVIQKWYKKRLQLSAILLLLLKEFVKHGKRSIHKTLLYHKDSFIFKRILKKHPKLATFFTKRGSVIVENKGKSNKRSSFALSYSEIKQFQESQIPLIQSKFDVKMTEKSMETRTKRSLEEKSEEKVETVEEIIEKKAAKTSEETLSMLRRLNSLRVSILLTRASMWKFYLSEITRHPVSNLELSDFLSKDSLYIRKLHKNSQETLSFEGSDVRLDLSQPITQRELAKLSPYTVFPT